MSRTDVENALLQRRAVDNDSRATLWDRWAAEMRLSEHVECDATVLASLVSAGEVTPTELTQLAREGTTRSIRV